MLYELVAEGNQAVVLKWLKENPEISGQEMVNSLSEAAFAGNEQLVRLLLEYGTNPNELPSMHMRPLFCAVEQQDLKMVRLLIESGADVNLADDLGQTALNLAVDVEADTACQMDTIPSVDLIALLLELGAVPGRRDNSGRAPIDIARDYEFVAAIDLLEQHGAR